MRYRKNLILLGAGFILGLLILSGSYTRAVQASTNMQDSPCGAILRDAANQAGIVAENTRWIYDDGKNFSCEVTYEWKADKSWWADATLSIKKVDKFNGLSCESDSKCEETSFNGHPALLEADPGYNLAWYVEKDGAGYIFIAAKDIGGQQEDSSGVMELAAALSSAAEGKLPSGELTSGNSSNAIFDCAGITPDDLRAGGIAVKKCQLRCVGIGGDANAMSDDQLWKCIHTYSGQTVSGGESDSPPPEDGGDILPGDQIVDDVPPVSIPEDSSNSDGFTSVWNSLSAELIRNPFIAITSGVLGTLLSWLVSFLKSNSSVSTPQVSAPQTIGGQVDDHGLIWSERPWDEAGPGYVTSEEYERIKWYQEHGYNWDKRHGWVESGQVEVYEQWQQNNRAALAREEAQRQAELERIRREAQERVDEIIRQNEIERKRDFLIDMEREAIWAQRDRWREVFSGINEDGSTSWRAVGYRVATGIVTMGTSEIVFTPMDALYRGSDRMISGQSATEAILKTGAEMGVETFFGQAAGEVVGLAGKSLLNSVRKVVGSGVSTAVEGVARELPEHLKGTKQAVDDFINLTKDLGESAVSKTDVDRALARLYDQGGIKDLKALEQLGQLNTEQAKAINKALGEQVGDAVNTGTKQTIQEFQEKTGVKIKEVLVGDSGSSANRLRTASINTDADRTLLVQLEQDTLDQYARQNHNGDLAKAQQELTDLFKQKQGSNMDDLLKQKGFSGGMNDASLNVYEGFGKPGPVDSYPSNFVQTVQAVEGKTTVFQVTPDGTIQNYQTSGQALVDQYSLLGKTAANKPAPRISLEDLDGLLNQQVTALSKPGITAEKSAKALLRAAKACGTEKFDPALIDLAKAWRSAPQDMAQRLGSEAQANFIEAVRKAVMSQ